MALKYGIWKEEKHKLLKSQRVLLLLLLFINMNGMIVI